MCRVTQELMDPDCWQQLVLQFRQDNFKLHQLSTNSVFYVVLQAGLSALKTPYPLLTYCCHCHRGVISRVTLTTIDFGSAQYYVCFAFILEASACLWSCLEFHIFCKNSGVAISPTCRLRAAVVKNLYCGCIALVRTAAIHNCIGLSRYIAITNLSITAVFINS